MRSGRANNPHRKDISVDSNAWERVPLEAHGHAILTRFRTSGSTIAVHLEAGQFVPLTPRNRADDLMHTTRREAPPNSILIQASPARRAQTPFVVAACRP